jgi:hypothetical protein
MYYPLSQHILCIVHFDKHKQVLLYLVMPAGFFTGIAVQVIVSQMLQNYCGAQRIITVGCKTGIPPSAALKSIAQQWCREVARERWHVPGTQKGRDAGTAGS